MQLIITILRCKKRYCYILKYRIVLESVAFDRAPGWRPPIKNSAYVPGFSANLAPSTYARTNLFAYTA